MKKSLNMYSQHAGYRNTDVRIVLLSSPAASVVRQGVNYFFRPVCLVCYLCHRGHVFCPDC